MDNVFSSETTVPLSTDNSTSGLIPQINEALENQQWETALSLLDQSLTADPQSVTQAMTAGMVALKLEDFTRAAGYFQKVVAVRPDHSEANYNLAVLELTKGHPDKALGIFRRLHQADPTNAELLNDLAVVWNDLKRPIRALATFGRAMKLDPENSQARNNAMQLCLERQFFPQALRLLNRQDETDELSNRSSAEIHRWKEIIEEASRDWTNDVQAEKEPQPLLQLVDNSRPKPRLAFFASHQMFIEPLIKPLSERYEIKLFNGDNLEQMNELMAWADLAWFEWCDNLLIQATRLPKTCRIICRLHSYEAFTDMPSQVDWSRVDRLVFVNQSVLNLFKQQVKEPVPVCIIYNGVDPDRFTLPKDKRTTKRIASVGYINYKKNPQLLLYAFEKIHQYDPEYSLHIAGSHQDSRIELYFQQYLQGKNLPIYFDGWVEDMPAWYEDKSYVISTSLFESFHYSIAEGMASGLIPLIHRWYGAEFLYPDDYLYDGPDDCLRLLCQLEEADHGRLRQNNRAYILKRYDQQDKVDEIDSTITTVLSHREGTKTGKVSSVQKPKPGQI